MTEAQWLNEAQSRGLISDNCVSLADVHPADRRKAEEILGPINNPTNKMIIRAKIKTNKIDKARLFKGKTDTYLDVTLLENKDGEDQYGNHGMIVQDVSKEEREAGVKGAILGNFKIVSRDGAQRQETRTNQARTSEPEPNGDDIPF